MLNLIKEFNGKEIRQREDGYYSATDMINVIPGKKFNNWYRNEWTKTYLAALASSTQISIDQLVQINASTGTNDERGTWIHPKVAPELTSWLLKSKKVKKSPNTFYIITFQKYFKIGVTRNLEKRLLSFSRNLPDKFKLIYSEKSDISYELEQEILTFLKQHNSNGEWHHASGFAEFAKEYFPELLEPIGVIQDENEYGIYNVENFDIYFNDATIVFREYWYNDFLKKTSYTEYEYINKNMIFCRNYFNDSDFDLDLISNKFIQLNLMKSWARFFIF